MKNNAIVDGSLVVNGSSITNELTNHDNRITTLENSKNDDTKFEELDGLDDFVITADSLINDSTNNTLSIKFTAPETYNGDLFEVIYPTGSDKGAIGKSSTLSYKDGKCHNVKINDDGTTTEVIDDDCPKIYKDEGAMSAMLLDLFTSGFLRINYIAQTKTLTTNDSIKCNMIDAENCFKLFRSPLPDFYEMKQYGEHNGNYYCDYGYVPGTEEFDELIEGQVFEFFDEVFGTEYKMKKVNNEWIGTNYSFHIPGNVVVNGDTKFVNHRTQPIMIAKNDVNGHVMEVWIERYDDLNHLI